jgi:hypothetical protein
MKIIQGFGLGFCWMLLSAFNFTNLVLEHHAPIAMKKRFFIEEGSRLYIKGTSNVNSFTCDCLDRWQAQTVELENNGTKAAFKNTLLQITTKKLDCHNGKIDQDLQKALKAHIFPFIKIELLETTQDGNALKGNTSSWTNVQAKVRMTIAGVTKNQILQGKIRKTDPNRISLNGEKALKMSDFGVDPPEAMFGLIKVNDDITIHFELNVRVEDHP